MKLTVSIVSYRHSFKEIQKVVNCVLKESITILYVIDNSENDSLREIEKLSTQIRYIHNKNLGYGAGHNIAIREAIELGVTYHVVVNPDIFFEAGTIEKIRLYMDSHLEIGQIMPKVLYPDGQIQYLCKLLPTPFDLLTRRFMGKYFEGRNKKYELRFTDYDTIMQVPSLSGCFMFLRLDILRKIGGFDERFFMYAEDIDLCRRIGEVSKIIYYPEVCIYHEYAKGSYRNKLLLKYHICSLLKYFNKWGWFWDKKRRVINKKFLQEYKKN